MTPNSFQFGQYNSVDDWQIKTIASDVFSPPKRSRKVSIPLRSGQYDYGAKYFDERILSISCQLIKRISRDDFREIIYQLSQKKTIRLYNETDKYYIGELYESPEVEVWQKETARAFTLNFVCEPFAYRDLTTVPIQDGINHIDYGGTAETPTLIILRNPNPFNVSNITLTAIIRRN